MSELFVVRYEGYEASDEYGLYSGLGSSLRSSDTLGFGHYYQSLIFNLCLAGGFRPERTLVYDSAAHLTPTVTLHCNIKLLDNDSSYLASNLPCVILKTFVIPEKSPSVRKYRHLSGNVKCVISVWPRRQDPSNS